MVQVAGGGGSVYVGQAVVGRVGDWRADAKAHIPGFPVKQRPDQQCLRRVACTCECCSQLSKSTKHSRLSYSPVELGVQCVCGEVASFFRHF